jgi:phenylacetate-CoA ligase
MLEKIAGNLTVLAKVPGQRRVPYLPEERIRALRDARVREIVRYAAETVPHYRELFRSEGIDPRELRTAGDLERLPLLEKETVQAAPERFVSESLLGRESVQFLTSGSTGTRLRIHHDRRSLLQNIAYAERQRAVEAKLCGKRFRYTRMWIGWPGGTGPTVHSFYRKKTFIPLRPKHHHVSSAEPLDRVVAVINEVEPDILGGFGSYFDLFFRLAAERGTSLHLPRVLLYGGDMMSAEGKRLIEEHFGVPVLSAYNAVEAFQIGFLCEERRDFHLHADLTHVSIVDASGRRLPPGSEGEVVISNLVNRGTVLLNYRLGDRARLDTGRCPCGRTLPLLSGLEGRVVDTLALPDGRLVTEGRIWDVVKRRPEVLRYQFIQVEPLRFKLRLVTADRATYDRIAGAVVCRLQGVVGPEATIEPSFHESLEVGPRGKFRSVQSLCPPA